jgi:hypothetical protein
MAIGTMTAAPAVTAPGNATPIFLDTVTFLGDDSYPTGGTAAFEDTYQALKNSNREVLAVVSMDCGGYVPVYDKANDKLKVYRALYGGGAAGPLVEVTNAVDLSGTTFQLLVIAR